MSISVILEIVDKFVIGMKLCNPLHSDPAFNPLMTGTILKHAQKVRNHKSCICGLTANPLLLSRSFHNVKIAYLQL